MTASPPRQTDTREASFSITKPDSTPTTQKEPTWARKVSFKGSASPEIPGARLSRALDDQDSAGFASRIGIPSWIELKAPFTEEELKTAVDATYRQLLNRVPLDHERLIKVESQLRNQNINLADFIEAVALTDTFQDRLSRIAPFVLRLRQVWHYLVVRLPLQKQLNSSKTGPIKGNVMPYAT